MDVVCSGPSSENVKIKSDNIVCSNFSILNSSVNNEKNLNKNIYWITGPHFYRDGYGKNMKDYKKQFLFSEIIPKLKVNPKLIFIISKQNRMYMNNINFIRDKLLNIKPKIKIHRYDLEENLKYLKGSSCGSYCLHFSLFNNPKNIYLSGFLDWLKNKEYEQNNDFKEDWNKIPTKPKSNKNIRHGKGDINYVKNLDKNKKKLITCANKDLNKLLI